MADILVVDEDMSPIGFHQADDVFENDTLSITASPDQGKDLSFLYPKRDVFEHCKSVE
jgi:hypothetical protein